MKRGDIFACIPHKTVYGSETGGYRPCIIVSNNANNLFSPSVSIVYLTRQLEKTELPTHVLINSAKHPSIALCEHVHTRDKGFLKGYIGHVTEEEMERIDTALAIGLNIENLERKYQKFLRRQKKKIRKQLEQEKKESEGI